MHSPPTPLDELSTSRAPRHVRRASARHQGISWPLVAQVNPQPGDRLPRAARRFSTSRAGRRERAQQAEAARLEVRARNQERIRELKEQGLPLPGQQR